MVLALVLLNVLFVLIAVFKMEWVYKTYLYIRTRHEKKKKKKNTPRPMMEGPKEEHHSYEELMHIIDTLIESEWKVNERSYSVNEMDISIHIKKELSKMTEQIMGSISPGLMRYITFYVSKEYIQIYVVRRLTDLLSEYTYKKMKMRMERSTK